MRIEFEPGVHTAALEGGDVLVLSPKGTVYRANATAANMLTAVDELGGNVDAAAAVIADRYRIPLGTARMDLTRLTGKLRMVGLIRRPT